MAPKTLQAKIAERLGHGPARYEGECRGDPERQGSETPHGWGTLTVRTDRDAQHHPTNVNLLDGSGPTIKSYAGEWTEGAPHGQGILTLNCGTSYEGKWEWYKRDRSPYSGNFTRDKSHWFSWVEAEHWKLRGGRGTKTLPNGVRFEGEWRIPDNDSDEGIVVREPEACLHGQGTEAWPDGTRYEGQWREGKLYSGSLTLQDGTRYEGEWRSGYLDGHYGEYGYVGPTPPDGMRDPARYTYRPRSERDRDFDNLYGRGSLTRPDGTCSQGEWRNGKLHGHGTETWPDGEQYQGEFRYGAAWRGTLIMPDGARIEYRYGTPVSTLVVPREP